jgi:Tfp pilus assembly protein PilF
MRAAEVVVDAVEIFTTEDTEGHRGAQGESMSPSSSAATVRQLEQPGIPAPSSSELFQSPAKRTLLLCLLLTVVVLVVYNPVTHNGFVNFDDPGYITGNPHLRAGLTWATVKWAFTTYEQANWHPLTWLSHALDLELFGLKPAGHHWVNVLLHAMNAVLLFLLLQSATGFRWRSLMVAALFALHPINVESVAWAAERKNVLSMTFFLLALYSYGWYARRPGLGKAGLLRYAAVTVFFALALLSKPQVIAFPFLLLLWDYWPLGRIGSVAANSTGPGGDSPTWQSGWLVLEKAPLFLLSFASGLVTMKAQKAGDAIQTFSRNSLLFRLENAVISYARYLGKALWPSKLAVLYLHPGMYPAWQVCAAVVLLLAVTAWVVLARDQRYLAVGWFWFMGSLVPMIGLVQVGSQSMADRYAYISFLGLFVMLTWLIADWAQSHRVSTAWLAVPAVGCLLALGSVTYRQVGYWRDTESLWRHALACTEGSYGAHLNFASYLLSEDRVEEAGAQYRAALAILPGAPTATLGLGDYEDRRGNLTAAIEQYQMVAHRAADPRTRATGYDRLGFTYRKMGDLTKAKQSFETALQLAPGRARAMTGLGLVAQESGDLPEAIRQYARAIAAEPTDVGYLLLAQALQLQGRAEEAKAVSERAAQLSLNLAEAQKTVEWFLSKR